MTDDLHARLLAEIERREDHARQASYLGRPWGERETGYLAALHTIVELHTGPHRCHDREGTVDIVRDECDTLLAVAEALGIAP